MPNYKECQTYVNTATDLCGHIQKLEYEIKCLSFDILTDPKEDTRYKLDRAYKDLSVAMDSLGTIMNRLEEMRRGLNFLMESANANLQSANTTIMSVDMIEEAVDLGLHALDA